MTLRVYAPSPTRALRSDSYADASGNNYSERLAKLFPVEVATTYPLLNKQALVVDATIFPWAAGIVAWIMLIIVIVLRMQLTSAPGRRPQWAAVGIAAVSFILWVYAVDGSFGLEWAANKWGLIQDPVATADASTRSLDTVMAARRQLNDFLVGIGLTAWTLVVPAVYRGDSG